MNIRCNGSCHRVHTREMYVDYMCMCDGNIYARAYSHAFVYVIDL